MSENLGMKVVSAGKAAAVEHVYREWDPCTVERRARSNGRFLCAGRHTGDPTGRAPAGNEHRGPAGTRPDSVLLEKAAPRKPGKRTFHRIGYFTNGALLMREYPRATPDGEQMDFLEVMEIEHGLIQKHKIERSLA